MFGTPLNQKYFNRWNCLTTNPNFITQARFVNLFMKAIFNFSLNRTTERSTNDRHQDEHCSIQLKASICYCVSVFGWAGSRIRTDTHGYTSFIVLRRLWVLKTIHRQKSRWRCTAMLAIGYRKLEANLQMSRFINKISSFSEYTAHFSSHSNADLHVLFSWYEL